MIKKFWMVIRAHDKNQKTATQIRHETFEIAKAEAERLCRHAQDSFVILEAVQVVDLPREPLNWKEIE